MDGIVYGKVPSKSNCYKVAARGGKAMMYKAKELKDYERSFKQQFKPSETIKGDFAIFLTVYYPSKRADLDNSLKVVLDCLQMVGGIINDRYCQSISAYRDIDKNNPRIEFTLIKLNE